MSNKLYAYLHTIDDEPAAFNGDQIIRVSRSNVVRLADSLQQVRREHSASIRWRKANGFPIDGIEYGYRKVEVPDHERSKGKKATR